MNKCKICNKKFKSKKIAQALAIHLKQHNISTKEYYDKYYKKEIEGNCLICNKETQFQTISTGYRLYCSNKCQLKNIKHKPHSDKTKNKIKYKLINYCESEEGKKQRKEMGKNRTGKNNPVHKITKQQRKEISKKQSKSMKKLIQEGKFTPCITNSWANSKCRLVINGFDKFYRSSWEAIFQIVNPSYIYEKIRIPYIGVDNKKHNYIVDFVDEENNDLYEIKPSVNIKNKTNKLKELAAIEWCNNTNYTYKIISDKWFKDNAKNINYKNYDEKIYKGMKQFL